MEMPKSCRACHLKMNCDECEGWECVCVPLHQRIGYVDDLLADKRRDDCPLVHIQPHGDLIDRDALVKEGEDIHETDGYESVWGFSHDMIRNAPTIIEAEEGE